MKIVVTGLIGQYAFGGVTWDYVQYALGFMGLGHDVWYLEDTGSWAYDPVKQEPSADCSANTSYLARSMEAFGMGDRWIYRNGADGRYHGVRGEDEANRIFSEADVLINVSGACWLRPETSRIPRKLFLDGDPMFTQIGMVTDERTGDHIRAHDEHFTFGLHVGHAGCRLPEGGVKWQPTVQPIHLESWQPGTGGNPEGAWTTVMNWSSYGAKEYDGALYGQKSEEFMRFSGLPGATGERFVLAMGQGVGRNRPTAELERLGWQILEPDLHLPDFVSYQDFLRSSKAEWSVAKNGYVNSRSGWFSCRSACYLALGCPVVVQDTGWSEHLPSGDGALAFSTEHEAAEAILKVRDKYQHHCKAARAYAEKHFECKSVCDALLNGPQT